MAGRLGRQADELKSSLKRSFDAFKSFQLEAQAPFRRTPAERAPTNAFEKAAQGAAQSRGKHPAAPRRGVRQDRAKQVVKFGFATGVDQLRGEFANLGLCERQAETMDGIGSGPPARGDLVARHE
jgi:hypothetical protein